MVSAERMRSRSSDCQPCKMSSLKYIKCRVPCHPEQSERPMHFADSEKLHRSFASLRMTRLGFELPNTDVARPGPHAQQRPSAANLAANLLAHLAHSALHCHLDRRSHIDRTGTGGNVGVKRGVRGQPHMHIARPGMNLPRTALRAFRGDIAAARFAVEAALHAARGNVSRASVQVDVARSRLFNLDIAAARAAFHPARD